MSSSKIPSIILNNGKKIPQLGYGVYQIPNDGETEKCVLEALKVGYRHMIQLMHIKMRKK